MSDAWIAAVASWLPRVPEDAACSLRFPEYRSNLVFALSRGLNAEYVMLQNTKALLASVSFESRSKWLKNALATVWPKRPILPLDLFTHEVEWTDKEFMLDLSGVNLPEFSLLELLPGLR